MTEMAVFYVNFAFLEKNEVAYIVDRECVELFT